jgi:glycosyltransferase involved in cell wall biosynthesis
MKLLIITTHMRMGGIGVYIVSLANRLSMMGHKVFVASSGGDLEKDLLPGIEVIRVRLDTKTILNPKVLFAALKLKSLVRREGIDMIHAQTRVAQATACVLSCLSHVPYVTTWHGFYRAHPLRKAFPLWGDMTIAISKPVYDDLKDSFGRREDRIRLVLNGVETGNFSKVYSREEKDDIRKRYGIKDGPVIGIISRLSAEKGHFILIESFRKIAEKIPGSQLLIVGEGKLEAELRIKVREYGIDSQVVFIGNTLNTRDFLAIMDVFARPGLKEGFGLAVVEAMLMGIPVVSSDVGGFKEMLNSAEIGVLVEPCDADNLARSILRVLEDKTFSERISGAARSFARKDLSAERMAAQTLKVYEEVLDGVRKK